MSRKLFIYNDLEFREELHSLDSLVISDNSSNGNNS